MKVAWAGMLVGVCCAPVGAWGSGSIQLTPVPGGIDGWELHECGVTFLDMMSPDGAMVTVDPTPARAFNCVSLARVWRPQDAPVTVAPLGVGATFIDAYLPGGWALVELREYDEDGKYVRRRYAFWSPGEPIEVVEDEFPDGAGARDVMFDASGDRSVIVGFRAGAGIESGDAVVWRRGAAPVVVEPLDGFERAFFTDASADGLTATGACDSDGGGFPSEAWVWQSDAGVQRLGFLPGAVTSFSRAISADGRAVVGHCRQADDSVPDGLARAFRWTEEAGIEDLGEPVGHEGVWPWRLPEGVSADGALVWGRLDEGSAPDHFVWTEATGMMVAREYLSGALGLGMIDPVYGCAFVLEALLDVSDDGRTWYVRGDFAGGCGERGYYLLRLPPACEGDLDGNGATDVADFAVFEGEFGQVVTPGVGADLDGNGVVDVLDFAVWLGDFGCE